jgi:uncharacterized protein YcbX
MMPGGAIRLTSLHVYPLKGAAGYDLAETSLDELGVPLDRRWMLVDAEGRFVSQRTHPRLALIRVESREGEIHVEAPGQEPLCLSVSEERVMRREVTVHGKEINALIDTGEQTAWFADFFSEDLALASLPEGTSREVDPKYARGHRVGFADAYPLHLVSESSLGDLNARLRKPLPMSRFRPNLVVSGGRPWEEDTWRELEIGGAILALVKPCARCPVTTVDQSRGSRGREPLWTLGVFRRYEGKVFFGQNAVPERGGGLRVGDEVRILQRGAARPPL